MSMKNNDDETEPLQIHHFNLNLAELSAVIAGAHLRFDAKVDTDNVLNETPPPNNAAQNVNAESTTSTSCQTTN